MGRQTFKSWLRGPSQNLSKLDLDDDNLEVKQSRHSFSASLSNILSKRDDQKPKYKLKPTHREDNGLPAPASATDLAPRMVELSQQISRDVNSLEEYMRQNALTTSNLRADNQENFEALPKEMQQTRRRIIQATEELQRLTTGPRDTVRWGVWSFLDTLSLQVINNFGIAKLVPLDRAIPLAEVQKQTPLDPVNLARMLRYAMTNGIFQEPSPGLIAHTASSRLLAEDEVLQGWVGFNAEDIFPAAANVLRSLKTYPGDSSFTRAGFNFAFDTVNKEPMFATIGKDPERAKRMSKAMVSLTGGEGYEVKHFVDNYNLSDVNKAGGTFVDLGGGHGFVPVALAERWDKINFVVQDIPKVIDTAPEPISQTESVAKRIKLEKHDFFTPQVTLNADVYFFRWIIHNYSTPYAIKILRNLIPALKPGARIVINDHCLREPGSETPWDEKLMRGMDIMMLALLNAQERDETEFRNLFEAADPRFAFKGVTRTEGCRMSIIEAVWDPSRSVSSNCNGEQGA